PRYASSAFSCADTCGDYWVTTSETAYEWHPERDEFGRAVLQRFGSDLDTQTGAFVCASGPTPDADPLTNDFATSLPPFSFEKMTPAQLASRYPEIESAAAGAMGSPALDGDALLTFATESCEALYSAHHPYQPLSLSFVGVDQDPSQAQQWQQVVDALELADAGRQAQMRKVCAIVKTTDRVGVERFVGLNLFGQTVLELTEGRIDPERHVS